MVAASWAEAPSASIPSACGGWAETAAAYRFLSQDRLEWHDPPAASRGSRLW
ncbi:transposase DNA-binding-containing protein [Cupriavidus sp. AcVe19-6a]|uniref:transposase DNA-binding-containing protein n=1 Tax=Cupriavidus sp. AcVe19-6a TaxID=2821358 RepID=UPI00352EAA46